MATPVHYCSLTSSDKVNEESISGRMMGETKNNRATSFERWGFYRPQYRHVPHLISAVTLPILPYAYWYHIELSSYCSKTFGMIGACSKYYITSRPYNQAKCSHHGMFVLADMSHPQIGRIKLCIITENTCQVEEAHPDLCNWIQMVHVWPQSLELM